MKARSHLETQADRAPVAAPIQHRTLFAMLLSIWVSGPVALGQCAASLQSGGPIATVRGQVKCSVLWDPDGAGPLTTWLVVGGLHLTGGDQLAPVGLLAFDGSQWRGVGFDVNQAVLALAVFNGELIASGSFVLPTAGGDANRIARRNSSSWQRLGEGTNGDVKALAVFAGELIAGGLFTTVGGGFPTGKIAKWNGTAWSALAGTSANFFGAGQVLALVVFGNLYVGGSFSTASGNGLLRFNGTTWSAAGNPASQGIIPGTVNALTAFTGTTQGTSFLVAAGDFLSIGGVAANNVARAGSGATSWSAMGTGLPQLSQIQLFTTTPFLGTPQVTATGSTTNSSARALIWTGTTWNPLGNLGPSTGTAAATAHWNQAC